MAGILLSKGTLARCGDGLAGAPGARKPRASRWRSRC